MRILITGGAGFVGTYLALAYRKLGYDVVAFDNLHRRGSETNLENLKQAGVSFTHGDIRQPNDLEDLPGNFDVMVEASAEPSVQAGVSGSPAYAVHSNLFGVFHALEFARHRCAGLVFLSTSRVYSMEPLRGLKLDETERRFVLAANGNAVPGISKDGISEAFPVNTARSFYGATKLAGEMLIQEYSAQYGLPAVINRCGVLAGPGQFGKTDQGVFSLWVYRHLSGQPVTYTGFGGKGKQVRDLLHVEDLFQLLQKQVADFAKLKADVFNVGGGPENAVSLKEWTRLVQQATGRKVEEKSSVETSVVDVPYYVTNNGLVTQRYGWKPSIKPAEIAKSITKWAMENQDAIKRAAA